MTDPTDPDPTRALEQARALARFAADNADNASMESMTLAWQLAKAHDEIDHLRASLAVASDSTGLDTAVTAKDLAPLVDTILDRDGTDDFTRAINHLRLILREESTQAQHLHTALLLAANRHQRPTT